MIPKDSCPH